MDVRFEGTMPYVNSFGDVPVGQPLLYLNSLMKVSFALNKRHFRDAKQGGFWPRVACDRRLAGRRLV